MSEFKCQDDEERFVIDLSRQICDKKEEDILKLGILKKKQKEKQPTPEW